MGIFKRRNRLKEDDRTVIEKKFEDAGQEAGKKTGEFVQKSMNKFEEVKVKVNADEKMEKVKELALKAEDKLDEFVEKAAKTTKETYIKVKDKVGK